MPIIEALQIAVSGFLVVFIMLVILWGIIVLISKAVSAIEREEPVEKLHISAAEPAAAEPAAETKKPHEIYGGEIALYNVDEKTAACLMAIVADTTGIPLDQLIFRSIKALD